MPKIVEGPKAKLMKETIPALRAKAKALNVSDYTKRTKENLVQSIMLAQARKKRGMGGAKPGRPVTRTIVDKKKGGKKSMDPTVLWLMTTMPNLKRDNVSTDKFTRAMVSNQAVAIMRVQHYYLVNAEAKTVIYIMSTAKTARIIRIICKGPKTGNF
jgi:hypothetical protein